VQRLEQDVIDVVTGISGMSGVSGSQNATPSQGPWRDAARKYALLPLRIFLGVTFIYAGLDKLTSSTFFTDSAPGSLVSVLNGVKSSAAIPGMIDLALKNPHGFGYAMAFGEIAAGLGALFGLLTRLAALGGALISLSLWLTVSWSTTPYYYGNDLPYLMAWLPLLLAGAPVLSLDAWLTSRRRRGVGLR
jgi:thiosulfate dehydrogenase [quinone] large subunit